MFLRVPQNHKLDYTEQLLLGRLYVLSNYSKDFVIYSNEDGKRDLFCKTALICALNTLKEKGIIEVRKKPRVIKVNQDDTQSLYLNIPTTFLKSKNINLSSSEKIVLGRLYILYKIKGNNFFYTDKHAEELELPLRTFKQALSKLKELGLIEITIHISNSFRRYRTIYVNPAIELESAKIGKCLPEMTPNKSPDLALTKSGSCTQDCPDFALSPYINEHNINEHINEQRKNTVSNTVSYPKNIDECKVFFDEYVEKYSDKLPLLNEVDLTSTIISFFDYYSSKNWHDSKNKPVKDVYRRVVTWMGRTRLESLPKKKQKRVQSYEEALAQLNASHKKFKSKDEPIDVAVDVVEPEQDLDDLPF